MKKKILHLVEAFGGGIFTYLVEQANSLSDNYEIVIAYSLRKQTPKDFKKHFNQNIKFIEVKNFTRSIGIQDLKALKEVKKIIKQENPDIIHMHSSKAGIIGRLAVSGKSKSLYYTPHGYSFLKLDDSKLKRFMYKAIEKLTAMINTRCKIIACSEGEYRESLKLNKNSTYVNNAVDLKEIDGILNGNKIKAINNTKIKICTSGRIGFQKNPEMFNDIAQKFPDIKFTWIGDGELKQHLLSPNIKITGWATREDVIKEVENNDIFILPSLWEGLPMSLLEAMYLGKICIVSNVIGNRDVIKNNENGFVCDGLDDYVKIITEIIDENIDYKKIQENSRKDVEMNYSVEKMSDGYRKIYDEYLG